MTVESITEARALLVSTGYVVVVATPIIGCALRIDAFSRNLVRAEALVLIGTLTFR
jgi:hypothetical protein